MLDQLARIAAGVPDDAHLSADEQYPRSAFLKRGLVGAVALSAFGRLALPGRALAANPCTGGSLESCLEDRRIKYRNLLVFCDDPREAPTPGDKFKCYREAHNYWKGFRRSCKRSCPPPPKKPPSKPKQGSSQKPPQPPPLPPNPYDNIAAECANCGLTGGKCCYGRDPRHLCACANPSLPCERYGCSA